MRIPRITPWIRKWFCFLKTGFPLTLDQDIWRGYKKHEIWRPSFSLPNLFLDSVLQRHLSPPCPSEGFTQLKNKQVQPARSS